MLWQIDPAERTPLHEQIAGCVRRAVAEQALARGDRLPPAAELGEALGVDRNTVLAAYRSLRDEGLLEFRRGRGVRVADVTGSRAALHQAAAPLVAMGLTAADAERSLVGIVVVTGAIVVGILMSTSLRVTAGTGGVTVRSGLLGVPRWTFPIERIAHAEPAELAPWAIFGGIWWS